MYYSHKQLQTPTIQISFKHLANRSFFNSMVQENSLDTTSKKFYLYQEPASSSFRWSVERRKTFKINFPAHAQCFSVESLVENDLNIFSLTMEEMSYMRKFSVIIFKRVPIGKITLLSLLSPLVETVITRYIIWLENFI